uniref:SH3 and multiple ankyrin repeat domains protein 3-like n=1 Tax=Nothoprocta perdicaria TaxID=30464 RepID=A0A8C6ZB81_NOTPE
MKKFASTRSLNKILQQCDSSSREYEEIQAVEKKWHLHLATPRKFLDKKGKMPSLFLSAPPPPKRAPSTTLTLRSKSMTAELEELGERRPLHPPRAQGGALRGEERERPQPLPVPVPLARAAPARAAPAAALHAETPAPLEQVRRP